jgi:GalNAc-alpha-(1->4)-GalNAc-alpha-(1->3)-diNAcBac-PP-undecaprenol alpha-1,4-N-acetyl-D-galactosaminyltransferase
MRICLTLNSLRAGGAERVAANLADEWVRAGHDVSVVTLASANLDFYRLDHRIERRGLCLMGESKGLLSAVFANLQRLRRLRQELRTVRPDVVVSFVDTMNVLVLIAATGLKTPVVVSERIDPRKYPLGAVWEALRRLTYRHASGLVVQTESVAEWARGVAQSRQIVVIPNPISDTCIELGRVSAGLRARRVVAIGRLVPQKGFDTLIAAFNSAAARHPDWSLVIAGQGPLEGALRAQALSTSCADRIEFAGLLRKPEELLARSEMFVLSSRFEGFPNALVEAMACGCAAISTNCPSGPAEIITSGVDGTLVPVDDVAGLAGSLEALMADDAERRRLGAAAAKSAERFRLDGVADRWIGLLRSVSPGRRNVLLPPLGAFALLRREK